MDNINTGTINRSMNVDGATGNDIYKLKLVVGLGNPGDTYVGTRHNLGFTVVDTVLQSLNSFQMPAWQPVEGMLFQVELQGNMIYFLKPMTFMNSSGRAVAEALEQLNVSPRELLVISDDLDMPLGRLRLRTKGSNGGHRGLASIANELGTADFPRLRLGIGRPRSEDVTIVDFVLAPWTSDEILTVEKTVLAAKELIYDAACKGIKPCSSTVAGTSSDNDNAKRLGETEIEKV